MIVLILCQVRVVILAAHSLEDIFVHDGDHGHDESHVLMDDLGLKRVRSVRLCIHSRTSFSCWVCSASRPDE